MTIARLADGAIAEQRSDIALSDVPEHKRENWKPVEGDVPAHDPRVHTLTGPTYQIEANRVLRVWQKTARDLEAVKAELCTSVDDQAEAIRGKYATTQAGMTMTYQEKFACANAVNAMGKEAANALSQEEATQMFAVLAASIGVERPTLWECSELVISKYQQWAALAHQIERTRLSAKKAINDSASVEAALAAHEAVTWTV